MGLPESSKKCIIFHGVSGSGKSTLSNYLVDKYLDFRSYHPLDFYYQRLEAAYKLPKGILHTQKGKNMKMNNKGTFREYLIEWFHIVQKYDDCFTARAISLDLENLKEYNLGIQSLRTVEEAETVVDFVSDNSYKIHVLELETSNSILRSSDTHYLDITNYYANHPRVNLLNLKLQSLEDCKRVIDHLVFI